METPGVLEQRNVQLVGYHDLDGRPGFKLALQQAGGRWLLYMGHLWHSGWTVVDVTDPAQPRLETFVPGPPDTWTIQVQVADGLMITALERPAEGWGVPPGRPHEDGVLIWDVASDPLRPRLVGRWRSGGTGTHRNHYAGGPYAYLAANVPGFAGNVLVTLDVSQPDQPREVSRWWWPGQHVAAGETPDLARYFHGPAYVVGRRAYLSYGQAGAVILDLADLSRPRLVSRVSFGDLGRSLGCHSAVPIPGRGLLVANSEAIRERRADPLNYAFVVDVADEEQPRIIASLPLPRPRSGLPYASYYDKGGRFGPHNQAHHQGQAAHRLLENTVVMTYFNAGLRVFDIRDPHEPREVGCFVPADPTERRGPLPTELVTQFEDVLVDARGFIYCTDKNHGLFVLRFDGPLD
jgi:hypothetical protein